jgi:hypothetical protein
MIKKQQKLKTAKIKKQQNQETAKSRNSKIKEQ